jgi:precorrin-2 dehydrogenase/sirohydrochlorin ferrochelatase
MLSFDAGVDWTLTVCRMSKVCVQWSLEELCELEPEDMDALLESYAPDEVPTFTKVRTGKDEGEWEFDGSFGWACVC